MIESKTLCDEKSLIERWVHQWGGAASEAILDSDCSIFRLPEIDGFIGYREELGCAIVYGDPVCGENNRAQLAIAFHQFCQTKNLNIIYLIASKSFAHWALNHHSNAIIEVGEELIFDPAIDSTSGHRGYRLRNKANHLHHLGFEAYEYLSEDPQLEQAIQEVGNEWQRARQGPQIYLGHLNFFKNRDDKRWFYVKNKDKVIATALLSRLEKRHGWLLKFLVVAPQSPRGTSETLMLFILQTLKKENCPFITYGMVPADRLGEVIGLDKFSAWLGRIVFKLALWFFRLHQRKAYWQKFHPISEPAYLVFSNPNLNLSQIRALMRALKIEIK